MTVDWFLRDAPQVVPKEFAAWEAARRRHDALVLRVLDAEEGSEAMLALDAAAKTAQGEADRLEKIAREAFQRKR